jgi:hypothetical protein
MNFGLAFSYVFKDKKWFEKILLPAVCSLIPIIGPFIPAGWGLKAAKNVIEGHQEDALPQLDFGADLVRGFLAAVITFIYNLPVAIVMGIGGYLAGMGGAAEEAVPLILGICILIVGTLLTLFISFLSVIAIANFIGKGEFSAAFRFKDIFGMLKKSFVSWLLVLLGQILVMSIIAPLGLIAFIIGVILTSTYATAVYSHLLGQAYNKSVEPGFVDVEILE